MKKVLLMALIVSMFSFSAFAQSNQSSGEYQEKLKIAEQIMMLAGSPADMARTMGVITPSLRTNLTDQIKQKNPQLSESQLKRVIDLNMEVIEKNTNRFATEILPAVMSSTTKAYAEKFSLAELNAIYQFQSSELGRKVQQFTFSEIPELMKPLMAASQKLGSDSGEAFVRIRQQLAQEGIVLK
jgi:hypothetical protein